MYSVILLRDFIPVRLLVASAYTSRTDSRCFIVLWRDPLAVLGILLGQGSDKT